MLKYYFSCDEIGKIGRKNRELHQVQQNLPDKSKTGYVAAKNQTFFPENEILET